MISARAQNRLTESNFLNACAFGELETLHAHINDYKADDEVLDKGLAIEGSYCYV